MNETKKKNHCWGLILSFKKIEVKIIVNIGDKYCIITAIASGVLCKVMKKRDSAIVPNTPLKIKIFLFLPKGIIFLYLSKTIKYINENIDLKKTSSKTGILFSSLTKTFINENINAANIIYHGPLFILSKI